MNINVLVIEYDSKDGFVREIKLEYYWINYWFMWEIEGRRFCELICFLFLVKFIWLGIEGEVIYFD